MKIKCKKKSLYHDLFTHYHREVVFSTNGRFPFRGGGLRKMVTSFLFLATLNFLNGPLARDISKGSGIIRKAALLATAIMEGLSRASFFV